MAVLERIQRKVKLLPEPTQYQVLDFVDYLLSRSRQEDMLWSKLSTPRFAACSRARPLLCENTVSAFLILELKWYNGD